MIRREANYKAKVPRAWGGISSPGTVAEFTDEFRALLY